MNSGLEKDWDTYRMAIELLRVKKISFSVIFFIAFLAGSTLSQPIMASEQDLVSKSISINSSASQSNVINYGKSSPYQLDFSKDMALIGSGAAMGISGLVLMNTATPMTPGEIAHLDLNDINSFDRHAMGQYREDYAGGTLLYGSFLLPFTFLSQDRMRQDWKILAVMGVELLFIQSGLTAIVKGVTLRTRPYVYDSNAPLDKKTSKDARISFYSGHTSTTAALSFFVAKVFSDYHSDKTVKSFIWAGAALYPALVAYLRVDSGNHFATDVITGYIMGALIGYFIPEIHKSSTENKLTINYQYSGPHLGIGLSYKF